MIPLSSIPTYSASMDSSSFLKTSFSKFPYPTKAELCYLTVVTRFPEEQIKIWFTAQRLKQGISWSPEEIEEARRKMFNTIIQTGAAAPQHTITVGIPHILRGSLLGQGGVIVTQPMVASGLQVGGAPVALALTPKPQAAARPAMHVRPAAAPAPDKGVVAAAAAGTAGGGGGSRSGRVGSIIAGGNASVISLSLANAALSNGQHGAAERSNESGGVIVKDDHKGAAGQRRPDGVLGKRGAAAEDVEPDTGGASPALATEEASSPASESSPASPAAGSPPPAGAFLDATFCRGKKSPEQLAALKDSFLRAQFPDQEEVARLLAHTGLTVREVRKWFSDRRYHFRNLKGVRSGGVQGKSGGGEEPSESAGTPQHGSAPLSPTAPQTPTSPTTPSRRLPRPPSPDFTAIRYKEREPHQVTRAAVPASDH